MRRMRGLSATALGPAPAVMSAVSIRRSSLGTPAADSVSSSLSSRPRALLSSRYDIGRPSGPTVGSCNSEANSASRSRTETSSGTSAVRAPPLGKTIVTFKSGMLPPSRVVMRHLADASDLPAVLVMQGMADVTFDHAARIDSADGLQAKRTAMLLHDRQLDLWPAAPSPAFFLADRSRNAPRLDRFLRAGASRPRLFDRSLRGSQETQGRFSIRRPGRSRTRLSCWSSFHFRRRRRNRAWRGNGLSNRRGMPFPGLKNQQEDYEADANLRQALHIHLLGPELKRTNSIFPLGKESQQKQSAEVGCHRNDETNETTAPI